MPAKDFVSTLVHELSLLVSRAFNAETRDIGLTRTQWMILFRLHQDGEQSQTELATKLSIAKQPLGKVIEQLETAGWVKRKRNPRDKRAYLVSNTAKVTPLIPSLYTVVKDIDDLGLQGLDEAEREKLLTHLKMIKTNIMNVVEEQGSKS